MFINNKICYFKGKRRKDYSIPGIDLHSYVNALYILLRERERERERERGQCPSRILH